MFERLEKYEFTIVAASLIEGSTNRKPAHESFAYVPVVPYRANGFMRIMNWLSYAVCSFFFAVVRSRVDLVYASSPHLLAGVAGMLVARFRRVPLVLEIRDLWPEVLVDMGRLRHSSLTYRVLRELELSLYRSASIIVTMAPGASDHIRATVPEAVDKIVYIPNGADSFDDVDAEARNQLRQDRGFIRRTAVYAGAHGPANGLEELLHSIARSENLAMDFVLVGSGVEKEHLQSLASSLGLKEVAFWDPVPKAEIPALLAAADIGLHVLRDVPLFRYGVSPNKVFDYMASGLPVVSNSPGLVRDILIRADAGWAAESGGLDEALTAAANASDEELTGKGSRGKLWLEHNQSRAAMTVRLEQALDRALQSDTRHRG